MGRGSTKLTLQPEGTAFARDQIHALLEGEKRLGANRDKKLDGKAYLPTQTMEGDRLVRLFVGDNELRLVRCLPGRDA